MSKPYQPANGTEGRAFFNDWCDRCAKDDGTEELRCDLIGDSMAFDPGDPGYPKEWVADDAVGHGARCTAFEAEGEKP